MKKIKYIIFPLAPVIIVQLFASYIQWNFNPGEWDQAARTGAIVCTSFGIFIGVMLTIMIDDKNNNHT